MTTTTLSNLVWRAGSTTENYNWIKKISDSLTAVGCALTSDTGQINLGGTTVAIPASPDDSFKLAGYQIRKLGSSGKPTIYIRVEYGVRRYGGFSTAANNVCPAIRIWCGTETNGAGVLGGTLTADHKAMSDYGYYHYAELAQVAPRPLFFSSDGENYLTMLIDPSLVGASAGYRSSSNTPLLFALERSIAPLTGEYDSDGWVQINAVLNPLSGDAVSYYTLANIPGNAVYYGTGGVPAQHTGVFSSSSDAGATHLFPVTVCLPKPKGPMTAVLYYYKADIASGYTFDTTIYGETRTYISGGAYQPNSAAHAGTQVAMALRYD